MVLLDSSVFSCADRIQIKEQLNALSEIFMGSSVALGVCCVFELVLMIHVLTFSCLKKHNIFNSRKTRFDDTSDWNTFGNFFSATLRPSRGSVTALFIEKETKRNN